MEKWKNGILERWKNGTPIPIAIGIIGGRIERKMLAQNNQHSYNPLPKW